MTSVNFVFCSQVLAFESEQGLLFNGYLVPVEMMGSEWGETWCEVFVLGSSGNKGVDLSLIYDILLSFVHNNRLPRDPIFPFYKFTPKTDYFIINLT